MTGHVIVNAGATLTIQPDVQVRFSSGLSLTVIGGLNAIGAPGQLITFTSDQATPAPGDWNGMHFTDGSLVRLDYTDIGYGGGGAWAMLDTDLADIIIDHSTIHHSAATLGAIRFNRAGYTPVIRNTTFANNANYPIYHYAFDIAPTYDSLILTGNGTDAVYLGGGNFNRNVTLDSRELGGKPYISGSITVMTGYTLTLAPGTLLQLGSGSGLSVSSGATLNAIGNVSEPITITSTAPDKTFNYRTYAKHRKDLTKKGELEYVWSV